MTDDDPLQAFLDDVHLLAPDRLSAAVASRGRQLGAEETVVYLTDYEQLLLQPVRGEGVPPRQELSVEGSVGGRAFRRVEVLSTRVDIRTRRLWMPLLNGVERLGVVEMLVRDLTPTLEARLRALVSLASELFVVNDQYTDIFAQLRRRKTLSLAAEIQWELLPPLSFGSDRVVIAGALEPAYDIGGDTFDYAVNGPTADLMVLDAVGHGLPAALLASAAVGAYRHARRNMWDLPDIAAAMNDVLAGQFTGSRFATAAIARLHLDTGQLRWVNAGHPDPLIVRDGALLRPGPCKPHPPLGLQTRKPDVCEASLHAGDRVVLYTDGIVEARSPDGEFFGDERLADFIHRASADGDPAPETLRRLMRRVLTHQADHLQDDASIVMLEWRTGDERQLQI
ncbi:PP2C family protein-serine/threonine phosphatase [Blastococcus saxobsidens]|uniref:Serine phosphatase RsbU, regulator of sigma subunit n=1 Tax=Blastococcus saxobsidens (strain DD2) TaxID=1146883 RepID=H6RN91_BLASD|nr:PP2C family protein-serine/threonine phosphatase [Blastococcus saxobsidens]CCG02639.1 Serine phosphatase RsbU, regulator of sigma subunit [Blastococcus saxobsidens DD2]